MSSRSIVLLPRSAATLGWILTGLIVALLTVTSCTTRLNPFHGRSQLRYPITAKTNHVDNYHGTAVPDPYRWLEDDNAPETKAWVEAQNKVTFAYLESIPERPAIAQRLTELWNYERFGLPFKRGNRYFLTRNDGLQNQSVLYTMASLEAEPRLLLDPNTLSEDGTVAVSSYAVSEDGRYLAYGISRGGSDWREFKVRDVATRQDMSDHLQWIKFSGASWRQDGRGFYYSRYDEPEEGDALKGVNFFQKLYFHTLGTPQEDDILVYERPDHKDWGFNGTVTDDDRYLIIRVRQGTDRRNRIFYQDLALPNAPVVELLNEFDASYEFIDNDGPLFWFETDLDAPRGRVIAIDIRNPGRDHWREVIPEASETLRGVSAVGQRLVANYLKDARSQVKVFALDGTPDHEISLPGLGSAGGFGGRRSDPETFFTFTSYLDPGTVFRYDVASMQRAVFRRPKVDFQPSDFATRQVFYASADGTQVPMFITHRRGIPLNKRQPTLLYGYGGFNISLTPGFSPATLAWLEMGGVYAVANLRGGGEYGESWHEAGTKANKQNVFDDFIAAAEWLIEHGYTRPDKLAIMGESNGGLLVGACMIQRPDLYQAALPAVGVMDMLRFHKFTIGWAWTSDYGSADDPEMFPALYAYSPYHNLQRGVKYPSTLITTADHDDRVVPAHSFKFAARLQEYHAGKNPVLIRIETKAGHGAGKPTRKRIEEAADKWSFLVEELDMDLGPAFDSVKSPSP